ncbi:unnamed protein product, partial [Meganyctiphanes norvegica]
MKDTIHTMENLNRVPTLLPVPQKNSFYRTLREAFLIAWGSYIPSSLQIFTGRCLMLIAHIHGVIVSAIAAVKYVAPLLSALVSCSILIVMIIDVFTDGLSTARVCHAQPDVASVNFEPLCWVSGATILIPSIVNNFILLFYYWPYIGKRWPGLLALFTFQLLPYVRQVLEIRSKWHRWRTGGEAKPTDKTALVVKLMWAVLEDTPQFMIQATLLWREVTGREDGVINVHDPLVYIGVATSGISISYGATMFLADPSSITDALIKFFLTMITVGGRTLQCIWWGFQIINGKFYFKLFGINEMGFILYLSTPGYALLALVMFNLGIKNFSKENETEETSLGQRVKQAGRTIGKLLIASTLDGVTVNGLIASLSYLIHYQLFTGISRTFRGIQKDHTLYLVITILLGSSVIVNMAFNIYKMIKNGKTTMHMFLKYVSTIFVIS